MEANIQKKLLVLVERDFKNTKGNNNLKQGTRLPDNLLIKEEIDYDYVVNTRETTEGNDNVVEILAEDIIDISADDDDDLVPVTSKWEDDEWYGLQNDQLQTSKTGENSDILNNTVNNGRDTSNFTTRKNKRNKKASDKINSYNELDPFGYNSDNDSDYAGENSSAESDEESSLETSETDMDLTEDPSYRKEVRSKKNNGTKKDLSSTEEESLINNALVFVCRVCHLEVKTKSEKYEHRKIHNQRYPSFDTIYQCPICSQKIIGSSLPFKVHYQKHAGKKIFTDILKECPHCPLTTSSSGNYLRHLPKHKLKGKFKCDYCTFSDDAQKDLTNHLKLHNKFFTGIYSCKKCSYSTKHLSCMYKHKKLHNTENENNWLYCPHCPHKFLETSNLRKHMKCHQQTEGFKCPQCTYTTKHICRVREHLRVHYDKKEDVPEYNPKKIKTILRCPQCPYRTTTRSLLTSHLIRHTNDRRQCADCPFTCRDKADMIIHVKWHKESSTLKCSWCSFSHYATPIMTKHKRLHQDDREDILKNSRKKNKEALRCPICKVVFPFPSYLKQHMLNHQTLDEMKDPYYCANCPFRAKFKDSSFVNHVLGHLKKDGIKCDFCSFRHDLKQVMTKHLKLHTDIYSDYNDAETQESTSAL